MLGLNSVKLVAAGAVFQRAAFFAGDAGAAHPAHSHVQHSDESGAGGGGHIRLAAAGRAATAGPMAGRGLHCGGQRGGHAHGAAC